MSGDPKAELHARFVGVGISSYDETGFDELPGAAGDIEEFARILSALGVESIVIPGLGEYAVHRQLGEALAPGASPDPSSLVIIWTGHADLPPTGGLRLVAKDSLPNRQALLGPAQIVGAALATGAGQILVVFDTCYSGAGAMSALEVADSWRQNAGSPTSHRNWIGYVSSAMHWEQAKEGRLAHQLHRLLAEGPHGDSDVATFLWSEHKRWVTGNDIIQTLQAEWTDSDTQTPLVVQSGWSRELLPNPRYAYGAPPRVVAHLLRAARGGSTEDETWYFSGRHRIVEHVVGWLAHASSGVLVVTGPAGSGKSAVLGLLASLSNPRERAVLLAQRDLAYPDPGEGSIDAVVYARGATAEDIAGQMDEQLFGDGRKKKVAPRSVSDFVARLKSLDEPPAVIIDGLDEAVDVAEIIGSLITPLALRARVLVGTRSIQVADADLIGQLQPDSASVLDVVEMSNDEDDIREYVVRRLRDLDAPQMDIEAVAEAVAAHAMDDADGRFLLAYLETTELRRRPVDTSVEGWPQALSVNLSTGIEDALSGLPELMRDGLLVPDGVRRLLSALAWGAGSGLPADVWRLIANALSDDVVFELRDVYRALSIASAYVVEAGEFGDAVYRLAHAILAERLRDGGEEDSDAALRVARALAEVFVRLGPTVAEDSPYLRQNLWRHCADALLPGIETLEQVAGQSELDLREDLAKANAHVSRELSNRGEPEAAVRPGDVATALFLELGEENPDHFLQVASVLLSSGVAQLQLGDFGKAVVVFENACEILRVVVTVDLTFRPALVSALRALGGAQSSNRAPDAAAAAFAEAATLLEDLATSDRASARAYADTLIDLARASNGAEKNGAAVEASQHALAVLLDLDREGASTRAAVAEARYQLACAYFNLDRAREGVAEARLAASFFQQLAESGEPEGDNLFKARLILASGLLDVEEFAEAAMVLDASIEQGRTPDATSPAARERLPNVLVPRASVFAHEGDDASALALLEEAAAVLSERTAGDEFTRVDLVEVLESIAANHARNERSAEAAHAVEEALTLRAQLPLADPAQLARLTSMIQALVDLHQETDGPHRPLPSLASALADARQLATADPTQQGAFAALLESLVAADNAGISADVGVDTILEELRELAAADPEFRPALLRALSGTLPARMDGRDAALALAHAQEVARLAAELAADDPEQYSSASAHMCTAAGVIAAALYALPEAVSLLSAGVTGLREEYAADPDQLPSLATALLLLAETLEITGRPDAGLALAEEGHALREGAFAGGLAVGQAAVLGSTIEVGVLQMIVGRFAEGRERAVNALSELRALAREDSEARDSVAGCLHELGYLLVDGPGADEAVGWLEESVELYAQAMEDQGILRTMYLRALLNLAGGYVAVSRPEDGLRVALQALAFAEEWNLPAVCGLHELREMRVLTERVQATLSDAVRGGWGPVLAVS